MTKQSRSWWGALALVGAACSAVVTPSTSAIAAPPTSAPSAIASCSSSSQAVHPLTVVVNGQPATGLYSLPTGHPRGIVVVGHGHTSDARSMTGLVQGLATSDGVIALAMDYRGTNLATRFGWRVVEGAQDSIAATHVFDQACPDSGGFTNVMFGISMGGNMSGIAVSSGARRHNGMPLFDYWFDVAGVTNVPEIYADAQAVSYLPVSSVSSVGGTAIAEMQAEFGGTPLTNPLTYMADSPVMRTAAMKASGLKGVVIAHGVADGEVTSDMSDQMALALAVTGIPVDLYTSLYKAPGTGPGLTVDGYLSAVDPGYSSALAGHVSDVVMQSALDRLSDLYGGGFAPNGTSVTLSDGLLGARPLVTLPLIPVPRP